MFDYEYSDNLFSSHWFPVFVFVSGLIILWIGHTELTGFMNLFSDTFSIRPDNQTLWIIILGSSMIIGGFLGIYRNYLYRSEDRDYK
jgi:hypothetical protein